MNARGRRSALDVTDHESYFVKPRPDSSEARIFGNKVPQKETYEDLCGPPTTCPACPDPKYSISNRLLCLSSASNSSHSSNTASAGRLKNIVLVLATKLKIILCLCVFKGL